MQRLPQHWRIFVWMLMTSTLAGVALLVAMQRPVWWHWAVTIALLLWVTMLVGTWRMLRGDAATQRALIGLVESYRDGDFSVGLAEGRSDLAPLVAAHNRLGDTLRAQRVALTQRELLLDTVVQNTPVAIVLVDAAQRVVLANLAARKLLGDGQRMEGQHLEAVLEAAHPALREALDRGGDALFSVGDDDAEDILHLSRRGFRLNGRAHELLLLRQLTAELRRQEVQTWKKVIRIISHELNNSLAPIASLAHSSLEMLKRGKTERLPQALSIIEERTRHLEGFIRDYARFAKLPAPRREPLAWAAVLDGLQQQMPFVWHGEHRDGIVHADAAQLEQALLNLLKNAHEAGGAEDAVTVQLRRLPDAWRLDVLDHGTGMSEAVIAQALLPFYSTKRHGTGLGLALSREIAEAHGGRISLANRDGGGLAVSLYLPD